MTTSMESAPTRKVVSVAHAKKDLKATDAGVLVRDKFHFNINALS